MKKPDYNNSILSVTNSLLKFYGIETEYSGLKILDKKLQENYNHVVLILLDGMGINIIEKHLNKTDGLRKNISKKISSVFPPTTVAATNSVLSGLPPIVHGNLGWMHYNKENDSYPVIFLNKDHYDDKKIYTENFQKKYLDYKDIFSKIKEKNPNLLVTSIFPSFIEGGCYTFKEEVDRVLKIVKEEKSFTYCYWTEPDATIHEKGVNSLETNSMMQSLNSEYERLIDNIGADCLVIVIADHGLIDIEEIDLYSYKNVVKYLIRKPALEPRAAAFYVHEKHHKDFIREFNKVFSSDFLLLSHEEVLKSNFFGKGEKHYLFEDFIGDYLAIGIKNKMFSFTGESFFKAHHAGLSKEEMVVPLILNK